MTKPTVTDAMLESAIAAWFAVVEGIDPRTCEGVPVPPENLHDAMRAAITAAIEASGLVEENARLRADNLAKQVELEMIKEAMTDAGFKIEFVARFPQALNKEPTP